MNMSRCPNVLLVWIQKLYKIKCCFSAIKMSFSSYNLELTEFVMSKAWVLMFDMKFPQSLLWNGATTRAEPWGFVLTQSEWLIRLINKVRDHFGLLPLFAGLVQQWKCSYWWVKPIWFGVILWEDTEQVVLNCRSCTTVATGGAWWSLRQWTAGNCCNTMAISNMGNYGTAYWILPYTLCVLANLIQCFLTVVCYIFVYKSGINYFSNILNIKHSSHLYIKCKVYTASCILS